MPTTVPVPTTRKRDSPPLRMQEISVFRNLGFFVPLSFCRLLSATTAGRGLPKHQVSCAPVESSHAPSIVCGHMPRGRNVAALSFERPCPPWLKPGGRKCDENLQPLYALLHKRVHFNCAHLEYVPGESTKSGLCAEQCSSDHPPDDSAGAIDTEGFVVGVDVASMTAHLLVRAPESRGFERLQVRDEALWDLGWAYGVTKVEDLKTNAVVSGESVGNVEAWLFPRSAHESSKHTLPFAIRAGHGDGDDVYVIDEGDDAIVMLTPDHFYVCGIQVTRKIVDWLDAGGCVDAMTPPPKHGTRGHTLLIAACSFADEDKIEGVVEMLLARGARADVPGVFGLTALHYAAWFGRHDAATRLLDSGANVNAVGVYQDWETSAPGNTPLDCAILGARRSVPSHAHELFTS